jgi:ABC-type glutathione transport system ATPase component
MVDLAKKGQAMIVVTHEMGFARQVADRVVFIDGGRILEQGRPEQVLESPQHRRTQQFLSKVLHLASQRGLIAEPEPSPTVAPAVDSVLGQPPL